MAGADQSGSVVIWIETEETEEALKCPGGAEE